MRIAQTSYNISNTARGLKDISVGKNRSSNEFSDARLYERSKKYFSFNPDGSIRDINDSGLNHLAFDRGRTYKILTADSESTGLTAQAEIRDLSFVEQTVEVTPEGIMKFSGVTPVASRRFNSRLMNMAGSLDKDGSSPLSMSTIMSEMGITDPSDPRLEGIKDFLENDGQAALNEFKDLLNATILKKGSDGKYVYHRLQGHNLEAFDLDMITQTMTRLKAYGKDSEANSMFTEVLNRRQNADSVKVFGNEEAFMTDTLNSANIYMTAQREKLAGILKKQGLSESTINESLGVFSIAPEIFEGAKGPESLENLFLNTNFIQLLEDTISDNPEENKFIIEALSTKGAHTADVDAALNTYISQYMQTGKLQMQRMPTPGKPPGRMSAEAAAEWFDKRVQLEEELKTAGFFRSDNKMSAFESAIRRRIARSSAATPVTNISDISRVSENVFGFLKDTEAGNKRVSIALDEGLVGRLNTAGLDVFEGAKLPSGYKPDFKPGAGIRYSKSKNSFVFQDRAFGEKIELEQGRAKEIIQHVLDHARKGQEIDDALKDVIPVGEEAKGINLAVNPYYEAVRPPKLLQIEATSIDRMKEAQRVQGSMPAPSISTKAEELADTLSTSSGYYGQENGSFRVPLVGTKLGGVEETTAFSETVFNRGLPFADLDPRMRLAAVNQARATSDIGKIIYETSSRATGTEAGVRTAHSALASENVLSTLSELGISHAVAQGREDIFGASIIPAGRSDAVKLSKNSYFRTPVADMTASSERIIMNAADIMKLKIPTAGGEAVQFGGEEFIKSQFNRFIDSPVKDSNFSIINKYWTPTGLGKTQYTDLAEQVLELQSQRMRLAEGAEKGYVAPKSRSEIQELANSIFNPSKGEKAPSYDSIGAKDKLYELARIESREEKRNYLKNLAKENNLHEEFYVAKYDRQVQHIAESIEQGGISAFAHKDILTESGTTIGNTNQILDNNEEFLIGNKEIDTQSQSNFSRMTGVMKDDESVIGAQYGPTYNDSVLEAKYVGESVESIHLKLHEEELRAMEGFHSLAGDVKNLPRVQQQVGKNVGKEAENVSTKFIEQGANFLRKNKKTAYFTLAAAAAAGVGYKMAKKKNENDLYESTIEAQPVEQGQRPYGIQEAMMNGRKSSTRNPMATAGVVGNLDRNKVGHTKMGPNKHGNLFKTAAYHLL